MLVIEQTGYSGGNLGTGALWGSLWVGRTHREKQSGKSGEQLQPQLRALCLRSIEEVGQGWCGGSACSPSTVELALKPPQTKEQVLKPVWRHETLPKNIRLAGKVVQLVHCLANTPKVLGAVSSTAEAGCGGAQL